MINLYFISDDRFPHAAILTMTHESAVLNTSKTGG
jgi:calcineurin-like phosphoesterase family protein